MRATLVQMSASIDYPRGGAIPATGTIVAIVDGAGNALKESHFFVHAEGNRASSV